MEHKTAFSLPAVGGSSLLTVFAVLCLAVFALLSLATVRAEQRLAEASAEAVAGWYRADCQAQEMFARLRGWERPEGIREEAGMYYSSIPISHSQALELTLKQESGRWQILRWQAVVSEQTGEETLPLWKGGNTP